MGRGHDEIALLGSMASRHGLVAGATGTGKTVTLRDLACRLVSRKLSMNSSERHRAKRGESCYSQSHMEFPLGPTCPANAPGSTTVSSHYLDRLMRRGCFEALWPLFAKADRPAKELTESYSALVHLRPFMAGEGPYRVVHVGDGAHARTGAMFSLKTQAHSLSVDPVLNLPLVDEWRTRFGIRRLECRRARIQDISAEINALPAMPTLITFVHAHVDVDEVLSALRWDAAFTLACCVPGKQLSRSLPIGHSGSDLHVLSTGQQFQVLVNH